MARGDRRGGAGSAGGGGGGGGGGGDAGGSGITLKLDMQSSEPRPEELSGLAKVLKVGILALICLLAFSIRLFAVVRYESVIHEFDPYFNFRSTKYLAHEGFLDFMSWFDDRGWYPLGRTIGGTIYPGLMLTAASIHRLLHYLHITINIRNMCVFLAPVFAANTAIASYLLTTEVTRRSSAGLLAAAFSAIVPSYISRSVGGSYDNEGVAIFALVFVFYLWIKAVHTGSMMWSALCALGYFYMVAAWGGYVFIINLIPIYVVVLIIGGFWSNRLYVAYSTFYVLGSLLAMSVPFVGFNVVQQAECAASHGVFIAVQAYAVVQYLLQVVKKDDLKTIFKVLVTGFVAAVAFGLIAMQLLGKVQWTGRSLTLLDPTYASKYIPIIASVSEHQPTTWTAFFFDLHILVPLAPVGLFFLFQNKLDGAIFVILYGTVAWYFAGVMVRLMLTLAPIACILGAIGFSRILRKFAFLVKQQAMAWLDARMPGAPSSQPSGSSSNNAGTGASGSLSSSLGMVVVVGCSLMLVFYMYHATYVSSVAYSSPSIVIDAGRTQDGKRILYDDYREAYFWLRQNTPPHAKILSWWDYGYQMSAMANRSVLVDNNTWNNTHIATVGRALASTEEKAYPILESLDADYVLVIFGGATGYSSDDINKFLWPVRIGGGVYPNDMPKEHEYYNKQGQFDVGPGGSPTLQNCVAYKLCYYRFGELSTEYGKPPGYDRARGREVGRKNIKLQTMEEAFTSEHWIVRIYKVLPRPIVDALPTAPSRNEVAVEEESTSSSVRDKVRYVGCFSSESMLLDRQYGGGSNGANINLAWHAAALKGSKYLAVARAHTDGHSFTFNRLDARAPPNGDMHGEGCDRPCLDADDMRCGCTDNACEGPIPRGEQHNRRWAVYEVLDHTGA